jgi:hypothetical protein
MQPRIQEQVNLRALQGVCPQSAAEMTNMETTKTATTITNAAIEQYGQCLAQSILRDRNEESMVLLHKDELALLIAESVKAFLKRQP